MSSIVVAEKKHQKPAGGCVGVLFHLFDWNRKLSKKKLFSNKLLPAVKPKNLAKKIREKLPRTKFLLIADENRGGFPNPNRKKPESNRTDSIVPSTERNKGMGVPGVVARLMGLDSMPVRDVPEQNSATLFESQTKISEHRCFDHGPYSYNNTHIDDHMKQSEFYCYNHDPNKETKPTKLESGKLELRPQKLQKTGLFERRAVTRFQGEALPFKRVISHSRKHHQKLVSSVKSPRMLSGKNAVRLMEAATKILEPGLQATSRAKCALTYSAEELVSSRHPMPAEPLKESKFQKPVKFLRGQSSCKSLENLLDVVGFRSNIEEHGHEVNTSASSYSSSLDHEYAISKLQSPSSSLEQERDAGASILVSDTGNSVIEKNQDRPISLAIQAKASVQRRNHVFQDRKPKKDQDHCSSSQQCKRQHGRTQKLELKQNNQRQNQILMKDKMPQKPRFSHQQSRRDPVPMASFRVDNQSGLTSKNPKDIALKKKLGNCKESSNDKESYSSKPKTLPQKRRPMSYNSHVENTGTIKSAILNGRNERIAVTNEVGIGLNPRSIDRNCMKSKIVYQNQGFSKPIKRNSLSNSKEIDAVSFMFTSPMKPSSRSFSSLQMDKKRTSNGDPSCGIQQKIKNPDQKNGKLPGTGLRDLEGEALNALLEQKLRELNCLDGIEFGSLKDAPSGRSTASLLQELLSALTAERSIPQKYVESFSYNTPVHSECSSPGSQMFTTSRKIQGKYGDHLSPVSIFDASFSSESCFTSHSLDSNLVDQIHLLPANFSLDKLQPFYADMDLSDSATSTNMGNIKNDITDTAIDMSSKYSINPSGVGLISSELDYIKEVISNAELLFENVAFYDTDVIGGSILDPLLFYELENAVDALRRSPKSSLGFVEAKNGYRLRKFLFDCIVEYLDLKFSRCCRAGFKAWAKLPLSLSSERLSREVYEKIRRWRDFAGMFVDEIIETEMSSPQGKWMDFEVEAFETGTGIESEILQILVDEVVIDLL